MAAWATIRALVTVAAMLVIVVGLGVPVLLAGLVYPSRKLMAVSGVIWAKTILFFAGARLIIEGGERVWDGLPRFYMGNHQSALDVPIVVLALKGDVRFMAKDTLFRIPVFGWLLWRYGYAPIHRDNARATLRTLDRMLARLARHPISFAVFPEGTRSRDGRLLTFRRGTMKVAQRSGLPIVPFSIDGSMNVHHRDRALQAHPGPVKVVFGEAIPAEEAQAMSSAELQERIVQMVSGLRGETTGVADLSVGVERRVESAVGTASLR